MSELLHPLTDTELLELGEYLLARIPEEEMEAEDADPGVLDVSELDGFLCALASSPELPEPAAWLETLWGDFEPEWDDEEEYDAVIALMLRHLNTLAATLREAPAEYEPLLLTELEDGEAVDIVDAWCEGYMRGVRLTLPRWKAGGQEVGKLLQPIRAFSSETDWYAHNKATNPEFEQLAAALAPNARALFSFWQGRSKGPRPAPGKPAAKATPMKSGTSPWGSGNKSGANSPPTENN
jgi:uncharacterized protein